MAIFCEFKVKLLRFCRMLVRFVIVPKSSSVISCGGVVSWQVWDEVKSTQISVEELTVTEFLTRIGLENAEEDTLESSSKKCFTALQVCYHTFSHFSQFHWLATIHELTTNSKNIPLESGVMV